MREGRPRLTVNFDTVWPRGTQRSDRSASEH